ncbi:kinase-like domain-containing protein [Tribonema minus]|uniref:Kinase-like domain-containing protein n=1 Tax=Tribonema minus TaxID=303371 RepID=A0A835YMT9_9STRA|nr:kinase-like domain-containing protein [Tribonema minus]
MGAGRSVPDSGYANGEVAQEEVTCQFCSQFASALSGWRSPFCEPRKDVASPGNAAAAPASEAYHNGGRTSSGKRAAVAVTGTEKGGSFHAPLAGEEARQANGGSRKQDSDNVRQSRGSERRRRQPLQGSYSEGILHDRERHHAPEELAKLYELRELIGHGTSAKVFMCVRRSTGERLACKVIDKRRLNLEPGEGGERLLAQLRREIDTLRKLEHPNIVKFQDFVETADTIYVVMELVTGGELFDYLIENGCMEEQRAAHLMHGVVGAIAYMHSRGIVHRDLKGEALMRGVIDAAAHQHARAYENVPMIVKCLRSRLKLHPRKRGAENLLLVDRYAQWPQAKLIDFGFSTTLRYNLTGSFLGTGGYIAPEIRQQRSYSQSVDIWACGVLIYLLNSRRLPFDADLELLPPGMQLAAKRYVLKFPDAQWKKRSPAVKDLLRHMLDVDPMRRWTAQQSTPFVQVLRHPWITGRAFQTPAQASPALPHKVLPPSGRRGVASGSGQQQGTPYHRGRTATQDAHTNGAGPAADDSARPATVDQPPALARSRSSEWVLPDAGHIWWRHHVVAGARHDAYDPAVLHNGCAGDLLTTSRISARRARRRHAAAQQHQESSGMQQRATGASAAAAAAAAQLTAPAAAAPPQQHPPPAAPAAAAAAATPMMQAAPRTREATLA